MEKVEKKIDEQLQFWNAIGPFMTLLAVIVCLTKGTAAHTGFAVVGLAGIPLCLVWKKRGMLLSLALLAAVLVYQVPNLAFDQQLWSAGIFVSFALSFFVTALSFEESSHIITGLVADSKSRFNQMQELDEKLKKIETELEDERNSWHAKFKIIEADAVLYKEKFTSTQRLVDAAQQELTTIYDKNKGLLEELFEAKSKAAVAVPPQDLQALREKLHQEEERALTLELQLEEKECTLQKYVQEIENKQQHAQKSIEEANSRVAALAHEKESMHHQLTALKTAQEQQQQLVLEKDIALQQLAQELERKTEDAANQLAVSNQELQQLRDEKETLKQKQEKASGTSAKKETAAYRKLQGMFKQLKEQFEEKCSILDETRRAQFHMQERLFNAQRELEEKQRGEKSEMEVALEQHLFKMEEERKRLELEYAEEIESLNQIIASLSK